MLPRTPRLPAAGLLLVVMLALAGVLSADSGPAHQVAQPRPVALGTSGGNAGDATASACCSGTLGALVTDGTTQYVLSNNHVLARSNAGAIGDDIIQPGLVDQAPVCSADPVDVVATLSDWEPIRFVTLRNFRATNAMDAAIAAVVPGTVQADGSILDIGPISSAPAAAGVGMAVQKSGRTTGHTTGAVAATNATIFVRYDATCGGGRGIARFANQIRVTPGTFSGAGDSGSLVVDTSTPPRAVGLLFAGSSSSTFANPIGGVLGAFGVTLVGASSSAQAPWSGWLGGWLGRPAPAPAPAPRIDPGWLAAARQARQRHEDAVLAVQGVVGLGVGASEQAPGEAAVEVYVARDTSAVRGRLPRWLDGVGVKVVETGEIVARAQACAAE